MLQTPDETQPFVGFIKQDVKVCFSRDKTDSGLEDELREAQNEVGKLSEQLAQAIESKQQIQTEAKSVLEQGADARANIERAQVAQRGAVTALMEQLRQDHSSTDTADSSAGCSLEEQDLNALLMQANKFIRDTDALRIYEQSNHVLDPINRAFYSQLNQQSKLFEVFCAFWMIFQFDYKCVVTESIGCCGRSS